MAGRWQEIWRYGESTPTYQLETDSPGDSVVVGYRYDAESWEWSHTDRRQRVVCGRRSGYGDDVTAMAAAERHMDQHARD